MLLCSELFNLKADIRVILNLNIVVTFEYNHGETCSNENEVLLIHFRFY